MNALEEKVKEVIEGNGGADFTHRAGSKGLALN